MTSQTAPCVSPTFTSLAEEVFGDDAKAGVGCEE